jgi:hypothetical protein
MRETGQVERMEEEEKKKNAYRSLMEISGGERPLGRPSRR